MLEAADIAEQFDKHIKSPKQTWLLGAGASFGANIPLMEPLTNLVLSQAVNHSFKDDETSKEIIAFLRKDIKPDANIEELLTHLSDLVSLSERSRCSSVQLDSGTYTNLQLKVVHLHLLELIAYVVRCGYRPPKTDKGKETAPEKIGTPEHPIVSVDMHREFVRALYGASRAGLENRRSAIEIFTTNYDTLIEDALALEGVRYQDGFIGGAVAYWTGSEASRKGNEQAHVTKLHGSIDWYRATSSPSRMVRRRFSDAYPSDGGVVMIFPQATKYVHAQQDPFAELFQRLRARLKDGKEQVLFVCGYSFGDEHINAEIDVAMSTPGSQLTVIAFCSEDKNGLPSTLDQWRKHRPWKDRVFVASPLGLYQGSSEAAFRAQKGRRNWWTFEGVIELLNNGLPSDVLELMS